MKFSDSVQNINKKFFFGSCNDAWIHSLQG